MDNKTNKILKGRNNYVQTAKEKMQFMNELRDKLEYKKKSTA